MSVFKQVSTPSKMLSPLVGWVEHWKVIDFASYFLEIHFDILN